MLVNVSLRVGSGVPTLFSGPKMLPKLLAKALYLEVFINGYRKVTKMSANQGLKRASWNSSPG